MSISLMTIAWKSNLSSSMKLVLLALCDHANDQGECYPSIDMLAEKCSLGLRTVQSNISQLEISGIIKRKMRLGRSTIYYIDPSKIIILAQESHYVYRIEDVASGEFYIGVRTCPGMAETDGYMGSGAWFNQRISHGQALRKLVISVFPTRAEAEQAERVAIQAVLGSHLCCNKRNPHPATAAPRNSRAPQQMHPTPADDNMIPPQMVRPTPAAAAPITIIEPSIEPSVNHNIKNVDKFSPSKYLETLGVDKQIADDWIKHRAKKKTEASKTVIDGHVREALKAGLLLQDALAMVCERGWVGFKSEWAINQQPTRAAPSVKFDPTAYVNKPKVMAIK